MNPQVLLLDEQPLVVQPSLVRAAGDHASALLLQQIHYRSRVGEEHDGYQWAVMSNEQWCEEVVLTKKQLERCIKNLTDLGFLVSEQVRKSSYDRTAWRRVAYERLGAIDTPQKDQSMTTQRSNLPIPQEVVEENTAADAAECAAERPKSDLELTFDQWWQAYPRKESKKASFTRWRNMPKRDREAAMVGLPAWTAYWKAAKTAMQYIPMPSTWLNGEKWNDVPPALPGQPTPRVGFRDPDEWYDDGTGKRCRYPEYEYR